LSDAFLAERDAHSVRDAGFARDVRLRRVGERIAPPITAQLHHLSLIRSAYEGTDIISYLSCMYIIRQSRISYRDSDISLKSLRSKDFIIFSLSREHCRSFIFLLYPLRGIY